MDGKSTLDTKSPRSLFGKVKHLLRSPRTERLPSDASSEGGEAQDIIDIRRHSGGRLSSFSPIDAVVEGSHRLSWDENAVAYPGPPLSARTFDELAHVEKTPVKKESKVFDPPTIGRREGLHWPTIQISRPSTAGSVPSSPNPALSARRISNLTLNAPRYKDSEVQAEIGDISALESSSRVQELEQIIERMKHEHTELISDNEELIRMYNDSQSEINQLKLDALVTSKFISDIQEENRELLIEISSLHQMGLDDSYSVFLEEGGVQTRPTSVASSSGSFLSHWSAGVQGSQLGGVRSPLVTQPGSRATLRDSASQTSSGPDSRRATQVSMSAPSTSERPASQSTPALVDSAHATPHSRRATTSSLSGVSITSSSSSQSTRPKVMARRDSMSSLRRTSHSHTPTQPSPLALDAMSQTVDPEVDGDADPDSDHKHKHDHAESASPTDDLAERQMSKSASARSVSANGSGGLPTPHSSPSISRRSTLSSSHRLSINLGSSADEEEGDSTDS